MIEKKKKWKLADFDYPLPERYIAQYPEKRRDLSKLLVLHKDTGEIEHKIFSNLPDYLKKNDLVVTNNTKVFPARLYASKDRTEAKVEVFLLRELENDLWEVMVRPARKVRIGNKLVFTPKLMCDVIDNTVSGDLAITGNSSVAGVTTVSEGIFIPDNKQLKIGNTSASPDFKIYHNTTNTYIENSTGALRIGKSDNVRITDAADNTIIGSDGTSAYLAHEGTDKLQTNSASNPQGFAFSSALAIS